MHQLPQQEFEAWERSKELWRALDAVKPGRQTLQGSLRRNEHNAQLMTNLDLEAQTRKLHQRAFKKTTDQAAPRSTESSQIFSSSSFSLS